MYSDSRWTPLERDAGEYLSSVASRLLLATKKVKTYIINGPDVCDTFLT